MTCKGVNIRGKPCQRIVKTGDFCLYHFDGATKYKEPKKKNETETKEKEIAKEKNAKTKAKDEDECCVCYDDTREILKCNHHLCSTCITKMSQNDCPLCRRKLKGKHVRKAILKRGEVDEEHEEPELPSLIPRQTHTQRFDEVFSDIILGLSPQELALNLSESSYNRNRNGNLIPV